jgi:hypothetical protein
MILSSFWSYTDVPVVVPTITDVTPSNQRRKKRGERSGIGIRYTYYTLMFYLLVPYIAFL